MEQIKEIDLGLLFPSPESETAMFYGRKGEGKTYAMMEEISKALARGCVVYTNIPLHSMIWSGFDQRQSLFWSLVGILGWKYRYYNYLNTNLHQIDIDENFHDKLSTLTDCIVAIDEGYVAFDSYEMAKMSMKKRQNVLHTRHYNRTIWITAQRPTNVHVVFRGTVDYFWKLKKIISWPFVLFVRREFDLNAKEEIDETKPYGTRFYIGKKKIFDMYNSKYLRGDTPNSQELYVEVYKLSYKDRWSLFVRNFGLQAKIAKIFGRKSDVSVTPLGGKSPFEALKNGAGSILQTPSEGSRPELDRQEEIPF